MIAGIMGFLIFPFDKTFQVVLAVAVAFSYIAWGLVHHYIHKDLYPEVIFEYIIMAFLGLILIFSVVFRS